MQEKAKQVAELLKLLANEHRLLILCALQEGELSVGEILEHTPQIGQSALSQHLKQLKQCGIITSEKKGLRVIYRFQDRRVLHLFEVIRTHYCKP